MDEIDIIKIARQTGKTKSTLAILLGRKVRMKSVKIEECDF